MVDDAVLQNIYLKKTEIKVKINHVFESVS